MAKRFQLTPDDKVVVEDGTQLYVDTIPHFEGDFGVQVPPSAGERIYQPGKRHAIIRDGNVVDGGPLNWPVGDQIIANIGAGLTAKQTRDSAPTVLPPDQQAELDDQLARKTAYEARVVDFEADTERADFVNNLKAATPAQIETFVRGKINADAVTNLATAQACLKRVENALVALTKTVALNLNR